MKSDSGIIQDKRTTIDGLSFYYKLVGDSQNPPLVFLHGHPMPHVPADSIDFTNVLLEFAKYFYVIAPEHIGTMRSGPASRPITMNDRARIICKLLDELGIRKAIISAQSFGAVVAASFALSYPNKIKRLILIDASTTYQIKKYTWLISLRYWTYKTLISLPVPLRLKRKLIYFSSFRKNLNLSDIREYLNQIHPAVYETFNLEYFKIKTPTLLIWGKNDRLTPLKYALKLKNVITNSKLVLVEGGHTTLYQEPHNVINEIVRNLNN